MKGQKEYPIKKALKSLKDRDITTSMNLMGINSNQLDDEDFVDGMRSLENGLALIAKGQHSQAAEPLRMALPIINLSSNEEMKFLFSVLADFTDGISKLFAGDAHGAATLLNLSTEAIERLTFFIPGFEKIALSFKAASQIAVSRMLLNSGNISETEAVVAKIETIYRELRELLDESDKEDVPFLAEALSSKVEFSVLFMSFDLAVLDFDSMKNRLDSAKQNYTDLLPIIPNLANTQIKTVLELICLLFSVYEVLAVIGNKIICERKPLAANDIEGLIKVDKKLFEAHQKANLAGERGRPLIFSINQLNRLQERFLEIGKIKKNDFGKYGGFISLTALVVQILIIHFTVHPTGAEALLFFLGETIISLIAGFGFEAIKFKPLLSLYSEAIKVKVNKG